MGSRPDLKIAVVGSYAVALVMDVQRLPQKGETLLARNFRQTYGGKGSDMAVQAARLGAKVEFVGVVGSDGFAEEFKKLMTSEGISTVALRQTTERPTGAGFIIKSPDGHNIITVDMGANELLSVSDIEQAVAQISGSQVMLIQLEIPLETALYAAQRGRELGMTTILNPAPAQNLKCCDLSAIDFLTPNETEARVCLDLSPYETIPESEIAAGLLKLGCRNVVITLGERGSHLFTSEGETHLPAIKVDALDTNGAGDAFNAALAVALGQRKDRREAIRFANIVAGLSCTRRETVPSYHRRREIEAFLSGKTHAGSNQGSQSIGGANVYPGAHSQLSLQGVDRRAHRKVRDTALMLRRFYFCERELVLAQAAWLAAVAPFEVKATIPRFIWENAMTGAALRDRVFELRFPHRVLDAGEDQSLIDFFTAARDAPSAGAWVSGLARVYLPALAQAYERFLRTSDQIGDGPTHRFLALALREKKTQIESFTQFARQLFEVEPQSQPAATQWVENLTAHLQRLGQDLDAPTLANVPFESPVRQAWRLVEVPARDERFRRVRFYWPDIVDSAFPYGEGIRLQLRSAVSHFNEVWAVETAGAVLVSFTDLLDFDYVLDAARWCYDESRHSLMGYKRLKLWGFQPDEIPCGTYIFDSSRGQDPIYRLGMLYFFETKNIGQKRKRLEAFRQYDDAISEHDMDFDWADEIIHTSFGKRWLTEILQARGQDPEEAERVRIRCGELIEATLASKTPAEVIQIKQIAEAMIRKAQETAGPLQNGQGLHQ